MSSEQVGLAGHAQVGGGALARRQWAGQNLWARLAAVGRERLIRRGISAGIVKLHSGWLGRGGISREHLSQISQFGLGSEELRKAYRTRLSVVVGLTLRGLLCAARKVPRGRAVAASSSMAIAFKSRR
jgi:hypothetical protein